MVVGFLLLYLSLLTACFARAYEVLFIPASCLLALGLWSLAQGIRTWLRDREGYRNAFRYGKPIVAKVVAANGEPDIETWSEYLGWEFHVGGVRYSGTAHVDRQRESWSISDLLECETVVVLYDPENPQYHALHAG
jgi:hypothetical protein